MKFLVLDGALLRNKALVPSGKLILSYLNNLQKSGKCYFGGYEYLADQLGLSLEVTVKVCQDYFKRGLLRQDSDGIRLAHDFSWYTFFSGAL